MEAMMGCVGGGGGGGKEEMPQCVENPPQLPKPIWLVIFKIHTGEKSFDNPPTAHMGWTHLDPDGFRDQRLPNAHL